jgi:SAM-dependent methyltransferase
VHRHSDTMTNADARVIEGFADEWSRFDQSQLSESERQAIFDGYFAIFPWDRIGKSAIGLDIGCGSGRWARVVAPRVGELHCIEPDSVTLSVAQKNLAAFANCRFHRAAANDIPLPDAFADFGYSLGVLHHVPDPASALAACVVKLKPGAPFLLYMYYALENRPKWLRFTYRFADALRRIVSRTPLKVRNAVTDSLAITVYWPLARLARVAERFGLNVENLPLAFYRHRSFYVMRTDCRDRFGTRLEQRFTREQIAEMMTAAGLEDLQFSSKPPYWVAVGLRRNG